MDFEGKVEIGFYMDRMKHQQVRKWCGEQGVDFHAFCRFAVAHFFFYLTTCPGQGPRDSLKELKEVKI